MHVHLLFNHCKAPQGLNSFAEKSGRIKTMKAIKRIFFADRFHRHCVSANAVEMAGASGP
jgi:hypothetical protein